jgi:hypothetical protein
VVDYGLLVRFQKLRSDLLNEESVERLAMPLAYWALPGDRRLPTVLMGRSLKELMSSTFEDLCATPGIGRKKLDMLLTLLQRAASERNASSPDAAAAADASSLNRHDAGEPPAGTPTAAASGTAAAGAFNPWTVSETTWSRWCARIRNNDLDAEPLGRYVRSLDELPRVLWSVPLSNYTTLRLSDIRSLKTHGTKRVRVIIETFAALQALLGEGLPQGHLVRCILPRFVQQLQDWCLSVLGGDEPPSTKEVHNRLIGPLLEQIELDRGATRLRLAEARLGLSGPPQSVRQIAQQFRITRARVYQLMAEVAESIALRWPHGHVYLSQVHERFAPRMTTEGARLLAATQELCFPSSRARESLQHHEIGNGHGAQRVVAGT